MGNYDPEAYKRYYEKNKEKLKAKSRAAYQKKKDDPEFKAVNQARAAVWYEAHKNDPTFKDLHRERARQWQRNNRERYLAWRREYRLERVATPEGRTQELAWRASSRAKKIPLINAMIADAKRDGCLACGEADRQCLQFHHVDPSTKCFSIGKTKYAKLHRPFDILVEIEKCVVLCANCHSKHEAGTVVLPATVKTIRMDDEWYERCGFAPDQEEPA